MTTLQAIVYAVLHGFTEILPLSASAHDTLLAFVLGWDTPPQALAGALSLGVLLALLLYFRDDWLSMISSFLQVVIYRRRPMTIDERLPFFLALGTVPVVAAWFYFKPWVEQLSWSPLMVAGSLAFFGFPLWLSESFSRKNKSMSDWTWLDGLWVGVAQILLFVPGVGLQGGSLPAALSRNYNREAAAKYIFYLAVPVLLGSALVNLREVSFSAAAPAADLSWLSFGMAVLVSLLTGLLAIGGFMKNHQRKGYGQYWAYRCLVAIAIGVLYWVRSRPEI